MGVVSRRRRRPGQPERKADETPGRPRHARRLLRARRRRAKKEAKRDKTEGARVPRRREGAARSQDRRRAAAAIKDFDQAPDSRPAAQGRRVPQAWRRAVPAQAGEQAGAQGFTELSAVQAASWRSPSRGATCSPSPRRVPARRWASCCRRLGWRRRGRARGPVAVMAPRAARPDPRRGRRPGGAVGARSHGGSLKVAAASCARAPGWWWRRWGGCSTSWTCTVSPDTAPGERPRSSRSTRPTACSTWVSRRTSRRSRRPSWAGRHPLYTATAQGRSARPPALHAQNMVKVTVEAAATAHGEQVRHQHVTVCQLNEKWSASR